MTAADDTAVPVGAGAGEPPRTRAEAKVARRGGGTGGGGDRDSARMARGGGLSVAGTAVQQVALFAVMAVLGQALGRDDVGRYAECWGLLSLLSLFALAGFRSGLTRYVAVHLAEGDAARVRGTIRLGVGITVVASAVIASGLAVGAPLVADFFHDPTLTDGIRVIALALPAAAVSDALLSATQGWRTQTPYALIGRMFDPLTILGLTGLAVLVGWDLTGAFWAVAGSAWLTLALSAYALLRLLRKVPRATPVMEPRAIFSFSMVSWFSTLAASGLIWTGTLLLGNLTADPGSVGVFNVATRIVNLAVFVMAPITGAFSPHMARLHHLADLGGAARAYGNATRWILGLSTPAFVLLMVFPHDLLRVFGEDFPAGAHVTMILAVGQFVAAATGPCGIVLNMSGRVVLSLVDNVGVLVVNVALCYLLIPPFGIEGAAVAWSASLVGVNLVKYVQARVLVGVRPEGAQFVATVVAALPAAGAALLVDHYVGPVVPRLLLGALLVGGLYVGTRVLLGLTPDDRAILRSATRRLPGRRRA